MENKELKTPESVPYIVYESELARSERHIKRLWIALILAIVCIVVCVGAFLWYLNQYDYVSNETVTVDGADGVANYIGKDGTIYNGADQNSAYPLAAQENGAEQGNP